MNSKNLMSVYQVTRNYGLLGGWLHCLYWVFPNGDPTGVTTSWVTRGIGVVT